MEEREMTVDEARVCKKHMEEHIKAALDVFISKTGMVPDVDIGVHVCTDFSGKVVRMISVTVSSEVSL